MSWNDDNDDYEGDEVETWEIYEGRSDDDDDYRGDVGLMGRPWKGMVVESDEGGSWKVFAWDYSSRTLYCREY